MKFLRSELEEEQESTSVLKANLQVFLPQSLEGGEGFNVNTSFVLATEANPDLWTSDMDNNKHMLCGSVDKSAVQYAPSVKPLGKGEVELVGSKQLTAGWQEEE